jgi:DNA-binding PadR family transcriptional regulator
MTRLFGRGELKVALLQVVDEIGPANGYAIMHELAARVGGTWRPSPGAIYPALLALEDEALLAGTDDDGNRRYELTPAGRARTADADDVLSVAADRAGGHTPNVTLGTVLDRLVADVSNRERQLDAAQVRRVEQLLTPLLRELAQLTKETS